MNIPLVNNNDVSHDSNMQNILSFLGNNLFIHTYDIAR